MKRALALSYGLLCYLVFFGVFLRAIWFVWTMDTLPPRSPLGKALLLDAVLLGLFAIQHSVMARQAFKRVWTKIVPQPVERSTYVLVASLVLLGVIEHWQSLPGLIWNVRYRPAATLLEALFWLGWLQVLFATFLIDHADLMGLKQVWRYWRNRPYDPPTFRMPGPYRLVRHPLYLGFLIAFWSAPRMTSGHLFFAVLCTAYILVAIHLEERDLVMFHGEPYRVYRSGVSMLVPWPAKKKQAARASAKRVASA